MSNVCTMKNQVGHRASREGRSNRSVYDNIPLRERAAFMRWNSDPIRNHQSNLDGVVPELRKVVRKAEKLAEEAGIRFVIGSGKRTPEQQAEAVRMGWSLTHNSKHLGGTAIDLWILDSRNSVTFDNVALANALALLVKRAATEVGVNIAWGGDNKLFIDRPHFELVENDRTNGG